MRSGPERDRCARPDRSGAPPTPTARKAERTTQHVAPRDSGSSLRGASDPDRTEWIRGRGASVERCPEMAGVNVAWARDAGDWRPPPACSETFSVWMDWDGKSRPILCTRLGHKVILKQQPLPLASPAIMNMNPFNFHGPWMGPELMSK